MKTDVNAGPATASGAPETEAPSDHSWLSVGEKGSVLGMRFVLFLATVFGRRVTRGFVAILALYYATFHRSTVRYSKAYLARVVDGPVTWRMAYRHILTFAHVALDRIFLMKGKAKGLKVTHTGQSHLRAVVASGTGAVLVGAHLGSFEAMRASADLADIPINVVGYFKNARKINAMLDRMSKGKAPKLVNIEPGKAGPVLEIQSRVARGELVALLADRVGLGERATSATFLGDEAQLPAGPFLLASILKCPVYLVFGLYEAPDTYHLHCEPFADQVVLPRKERKQALKGYAQRYADRLAFHCRASPYNWFNFFDFWKARARKGPQ